MSLYSFINALTIGSIFALMALGLFISFRIARFPDLTCDGSYALGACATASLIHSGVSPLWTPAISLLVGFIAGFITGTMYSRLKFPHVVSGIIVMTAAYSINLLLMGVPNLSIRVEQSISGIIGGYWKPNFFGESVSHNLGFVVLMVILVITIFILTWRFLSSEIGLQWRCVGIDQQLAQRNGINTAVVIPVILGCANAVIALAGSFFVHYQRFADVNMGVGIIMVGLASVFMGQAFETIWQRRSLVSMGLKFTSVFLAAILYRLLVTEAYEIGLPTSLFNLVTAGLVFLALLSPGIRSTWIRTFSRT